MDELVLSWQIEDICNQDLYKDQVKKIPDEFQSINEYLESYTLPLIEETRAELFSGLEIISEAPCAEIQHIELCDTDTKLGLVCNINIPADGFSGKTGSTTDMYEPKNGDVFILSSLKPESIDDLLRYGVSYCFAIVKKVEEVELDEVMVKQFTMSVSQSPTDEIQRCTFALYLTSTVTNSRIWKALHYNGVDRNFTLLKKVLCRNQMEESLGGSTNGQNNPEINRLVDQLLSMDLNQSQLKVVKSTISDVRCNKLSAINLVWGPPGTGKTKTVGSIIWSLKQLKIRTLTCGPTNVAVLGVCSRLVQLLKNFDGNNGDSIGPPLSLSDVVLFGNRGRMDIVGGLEDVFLDNRINRLENCFLSENNWRLGVASMIHFLEDCVNMYDNKDNKDNLGFGDYLRQKFKKLQKNLSSCFRTMFVHLPRRFLSSENSSCIVSLMALLREISGMLSSSGITDEQLKLTLETPACIFFPQEKLFKAREECLKQLRDLNETLTLSLSSLTNGVSIKDFCLHNATLVFCTASSSFLLHNAQTSCFDVIVIDEAAQLKECESVIPLTLNHVKHALLVGDECQLPVLVQSKASKRAGFGRSLFERLVSLQHEKHLLNVQYRMHPSISLFPNNRFYDGQILNGPNVLEEGYNSNYLDFKFGSYAFLHIADGREESDEVGKSWINWVEVAVIVHLIKSLYESWKRMKGKLTIGIISPYTAQVRTIKDKIGQRYDKYNHEGFEVRVESIDGFQGQEDDVIILSMVRSNTKGSAGFLNDNQRTNVAITRARHCLWIVGNATTMSNSGTVWSEIAFDAKQRGHLFDAKDVEDLANLILNVKNELDQLVDIMNQNSILFNSTRWKVVFSDEFLRSFARLRMKTTRMGLIQMLLRLAGGWRSKRRNLSMANRSNFHLARVYAVAEHYLVWSIDLQKDQQVYIQIIKLWNFVPQLSDVEGLLKRMDYIFSMYTDAYIERCKTIFLEGSIEVPMMWRDGHEIAQYKNNNQHLFDTNNSSFLEDSKVNESLVLMRFYALSSGVVKHLLMARDGWEIDIPFELNEQEMEIILFRNSSFILGRSGTGKTTVLTTKLVRMEQQFFVASHGIGYSDGGEGASGHENEQMEDQNIEVGFIKQLFLTVSPKLCSAIQGQVNRLVRFANFGELSGAIDSVTMHDAIDKLDEFADIPDQFNALTRDHYPLIITFRKFLMMLDGTIGFSFFNKFYSDWGVSIEQGVSSKSHTLQTLIQSKEVDFDKFYGSYWPHFNEKLTKNLDASTVFTQIISHIKGEFGSAEGAIGKEQYVALSEKRFSSLSSAIRERVYDIFREYEKKKQVFREFDLSDFVNDLHNRLNSTAGNYFNYKVDFIYIDEVQDLTVSQIALLKYICNNFEDGFVFAGDTAQTIARGIDFRFEDIRSLFYKEFHSKLKGKEKEIRLSDMFQLCQNFRTHIGVLKLAQSVIDLLYYFFPFSVDKLNPETSLINGDAPVLLESGDDENAITKIFGESNMSSGTRTMEFGAEQVILVRDDSTKREILEIVGKRALVLTIIDSKGLEFQDVLLYNFFGSSPLENKWRVLYGYLEKEDLGLSITKQRFDIASHYLLCSELKQLYVAITRTKQRLWICENSMEFGKPMFHYWKRLYFVQETQLDMNFVEAMWMTSTQDDWRVRGIKLFNEKQFEMARMCFEKAGDVYRESWARASGLVEEAERHTFTNLEKANSALQKAADLYETIQMYSKAAACYIKLKNYAKAGTIYLEKCGTSRLEDAADCFEMIKCWPRAADLYFQANCFSKCSSACFKGKLFDAGLEYLDKWQLQEEQSTDKWKFKDLEAIRDDYIMNCANHLSRRGDLKNMMRFVKEFKSMEEIRKFLMEKMLLDELLTLELEAGNFVEAAGIARLKEDLLLEARVWEKAGSFEKATKLVILDVIMESLWLHGSKGWPPKSFPKSEVHFTKAKVIAKKVSMCFYNSVCSELYIWDDEPKTFSKLSKLLHEAQMIKNTRLTFLSLRSLLDLHLIQENSGYLFEAKPLLDLENWFQEMMAQGTVSLDTLIHIWVQWREAATEVSSSLYDHELCHDYLGVRKEDNNGAYCVLNPNVGWIGGGVKALLNKSSSGRYLMTSKLYISTATSYWKSEIFNVGKAVAAKLDSLLRSSSKQTLSPETRGRIALSVYEIIKSLEETSIYKDNNINFQSYMFSVDQCFWDAIFPWDLKNRATQDVLSIMDFPTASELVDESIDRFLNHISGQFTFGQLGKLSMILLLSGKLPENRFAKIMQCTENMQEWRELFASLKVLFNINSGFERISMVESFQEALQATFDVDWRRQPNYMAPHCYLYLLELLAFFASSCLGSAAGYMITTRSVLAEIMKLKGCKNFLDSPLDQMVPGAGPPSNSLSLFEFIVYSVIKLLRNKSEMCKWIDTCSYFLPGNFYRQMVLRLAIILHMPYLNMSLDIYSAGKFLSSRNDISRDLPWQFSSIKLHQGRDSRETELSLIAFVDAFASVGDPLVVISSKEDNFVLPRSNSFFFSCNEMKDKDHVMSILFPRSTGSDVTTVAEADVTEGTQDSQGNNAEDRLVKMLEAFRHCAKIDIAGTVDILGALLSWLQNKPPMGFYDQLIRETRSVYDHFEKINFPDKEKYSYPSLEALYSYWQDGEAKLNLIIDTLISKKPSIEASQRFIKCVTPTVEVKKEVKENDRVVDTPKEVFWKEIEAFHQKSYQKDDLKSIAKILLAALSLLDEKESLRSFDEHLIEEMKSMYSIFSDLLARGDGPTLEDLYSRWLHGEIKLKLIIDTLLYSRLFHDTLLHSRLLQKEDLPKTKWSMKALLPKPVRDLLGSLT